MSNGNWETSVKKEKAHTDSIWSVAWRNKYIVTGSVDGHVKAWTPDQLELKNDFYASPLAIVSVASTGSLATASGMDSHIRVWDIEQQAEATDGGSAAAASATTVATQMKPLREIECGPVETWQLAVHPNAPSSANNLSGADTPFVATTGQSGHVNIWNFDQAKAIQHLDTGSSKFSMSVDYNHDGSLVASASMSGTISVFQSSTAKKLRSIEGHTMCVRSLSFSNDSRTLASGSDDSHIHTYDMETGQQLAVMTGHGAWVLAVKISPNGKYLASASADKKIKIWTLSNGECVQTLTPHTEAVWGLAWNNLGDRFASVGDDGMICVHRSTEK